MYLHKCGYKRREPNLCLDFYNLLNIHECGRFTLI